MSYQYAFCPTCNTSRVAYERRCSVCDQTVRPPLASYPTRESLVEAVYRKELAAMLTPARQPTPGERGDVVRAAFRGCRTNRFTVRNRATRSGDGPKD